LTSYKEGTIFHAEKTVDLGILTFHYGKLGNSYGWVQDTKLNTVESKPVYSDASFAAKIKSTKNSGLFSPLTSTKGAYANMLLDQTLYINREAQYNGGTYYLINREYGDRMQGWMKAEDLNLWNISDERVNTESYTLTRRTGGLLTDP
ncbi:GW dipeptide domain-containing protein, partial [Micrococcus sp. SIMBA_144]